MKKEKEVIKLDDVKSITRFLKKPTIAIAEAITGICAADFSNLKLSMGKIIQAGIKGNLLTQFGREIKKYRDAGKIKEDFLESDMNKAILKDVLGFIDGEVPDEIRFKAIKSLFFSSVEKDVEQERELLVYQVLQIVKQLTSAEISILSANFNILSPINDLASKEHFSLGREHTSINDWAKIIAKQIGHNLSDLVLQNEQHLIDLRLISDRHYVVDTTRIVDNFLPTSYYRLTDLGYKLCELIIKYN